MQLVQHPFILAFGDETIRGPVRDKWTASRLLMGRLPVSACDFNELCTNMLGKVRKFRIALQRLTSKAVGDIDPVLTQKKTQSFCIAGIAELSQ
jgi:hypothetical protein